MQHLVSLIVPVYNVEEYIVKCLESIDQQTYQHIEVLIIDDCGSDKSIEIAEEFIRNSTRSPQYRIIHNAKNLGLSGARNVGIKDANGEYIYFIDSDDYISQNCIELLVEAAIDNNTTASIAQFVTVKGEKFIKNELEEIVVLKSHEDIMRGYSSGLLFVMAWNKLVKRQFVIDNNLYFEEGILHEDVVWSFKLFSLLDSISVVPDATYFYMIRINSIMTSLSVEKDVEIYSIAFRKIYEFARNGNLLIGMDQYAVIEGKKSCLLYSLLELGENAIYDKYYKIWHSYPLISPWQAYRSHIILKQYLLRDFHYILPCFWGKIYKKISYLIAYKWQNRNIKGNPWRQTN